MNESNGSNPQFKSFIPVSDALKRAAEITVRKSLRIQPDEKVLIITNPVKDVASIAWAIYDAVLDSGGHPVIMFQPVKSQLDFAEDAVISAFDSQPDAVISLSANKMGKDRDGLENPYDWDGAVYEHVFHYQLYGARTVRAFWSPNVTVAMYEKTVPIDYAELKSRCEKIRAILDRSVSVRVTNPGGTDVTIGIRGRKAKSDDGDFSRPGSGGNLPAGEVFVSPAIGTSEGVIVFDGSISSNDGDIVIKTPITCAVKAGYVTSIEGGEEAAKIRESVDMGRKNALAMADSGKFTREKAEEFAKNASNLGELGIGLNPMADIIGNMLQDEKAFKTCHFAIGHNYDNDAPALIHMDGLVTNPTIVAIAENGVETIIEKDGNLLV